MKRSTQAVMLVALVTAVTWANTNYEAGANWAKQNQGQGTGAINGFDPGAAIPGYTTNPAEKGYYGGVTSPGVDLSAPGMSALNNSEAGKAITGSILNTPADNKPSMDAPFIAAGTDMQARADSVTNASFDGCQAQNATFSEFTTHTCNRDVKVDQYCTRTATITGDWSEAWEIRYVTASPDSFSFQSEGKNARFSFMSPMTGTVMQATLQVWVAPNRYLWNLPTSFMNTQFNLQGSTSIALSAAGMTLSEGQLVSGVAQGTTANAANLFNTQFVQEKSSTFTLVMVMNVKVRVFNPRVVWSESCPFSKAEGALSGSQCIEPGSTKTVYVEGKPYSLTEACWQWKDTYLTQSDSEGNCGEYIHNAACTVSRSQCADTVDGLCINQQITYSCENKITGSGMLCGGQFFCTDGSCAQAATGTNNMFGQAVSSLAAVAAAGKDVSELNNLDVRAFTGESQSCKKFAAGFSNCCKDSGWGLDVGLSSCSSDEKALGKAKEKKITVYVGEYCSKKVLGVCLEKKRGYCVFGSKLARIVQEQGRRDQLGIGFGSGDSPDCRGITVNELQRVNFGVMDFSDFYHDLEENAALPEDNALLEKARQILAGKTTGGSR